MDDPTFSFDPTCLTVHNVEYEYPQKAVDYLERATELEPSDPEITGHLGDVYWVLGRYDEARFKWRLARSLSADDEERAMLTSRLENGLSPDDIPAAN